MAKTNTKEIALSPTPATLIPAADRQTLSAWCSVYMGVAGAANSDHTVTAKTGDLKLFLAYFTEATGSDEADLWTPAITEGFVKYLLREKKDAAGTVNRRLASLRKCAGWIHRHRPFLAGHPCDGVRDLVVDDPEWKGLTDIQVVRLKAATEQLLQLQTRRNQHPIRNRAIFLTLLHTALRVSELVALDLAQYRGKHFTNVKRKGRNFTRQVFLAKPAREAMDRHLDKGRGRKQGPLFCSRSGQRLCPQDVDDILKAIAAQANAKITEQEHIHLSAHVLRHTMLRKAAQQHGVHYAKELAGHASDRYIWRYVQPSAAEKEAALEELF